MKTVFQHFHANEQLTSTEITAARRDDDGNIIATVDGEEMPLATAGAKADGLTIRVRRFMAFHNMTSVDQLVGNHFFRMNAPGTDQGWLIDVTDKLKDL